MPDIRLKTLAQRYIDTLNTRDVAKLVDLFHIDATIEDPVGTPLRRGAVEIKKFYDEALRRLIRVETQVPPRGSHGDSAAYAFKAHLQGLTLDVIGVLTFDKMGLITSMRAYHGPTDLKQIAPAG